MIGRDLRDGFRAMTSRRSYSVTIVVTLALGIGLNAAVFAVVDWVLLRPLPYPSSASLVRVSAGDRREPTGEVSYSEADAFSRAVSFRASAAFSLVTRVASAPAIDPVHVTVARVTGDLFGVLGAFPALGRPFDVQELTSGSRVVVVSDAMWRTQLGAEGDIVGTVVTLDNQPHTVVGVMGPGQGYPREADLWRPSTAAEREDDDRENVMIARLVDGTAPERATRELSAFLQTADVSGRFVWVDGLQTSHVRNVRAVLILVLIGAALVLCVACGNVAALIGTRGIDRAGELAIRSALGASRFKLARQLLVEGLLLAIAGGAVGIIVGSLGLDVLVRLAPGGLPRLDEIRLDTRVMLMSVVVMVFVGISVSIAPAVRAAGTDLRTSLNAAAALRTIGTTGPRRLLVTAQIAAAVVLVMSAALFSRSLQQALAVDHGFEPASVITVPLNVRGMPPDAARALFLTLADQAATVPGVSSAAVAFRLPSEIAGLRSPMRADAVASDHETSVAIRVITPRYFETVGIPVSSGRTITSSDTRDRPRVGIVNRALVREMLADRSPLGVRLTGALIDGGVTIVGVAADVTPAGEADRPALYVSYAQLSINAGTLVVKTADDPSRVMPALRSRLRDAAPSLPLDRIAMLADIVSAGRAVVRFTSVVTSAFGVLALLLAIIGVYGLASREVTLRWRESGLRAALGASRVDVGWELLKPIALLLLAGLAIGIPGAAATSISIQSMLHGVGPIDPLSFVLVPAVITLAGATAAVAALWPVVRSEPASALR
jgi:predicted permease